jgi:hypothetical protein
VSQQVENVSKGIGTIKKIKNPMEILDWKVAITGMKISLKRFSNS